MTLKLIRCAVLCTCTALWNVTTRARRRRLFIPYFATGIESVHEEAAFKGAWEYISARVQDSTIYYYSKYERTEYKKLAAKFHLSVR